MSTALHSDEWSLIQNLLPGDPTPPFVNVETVAGRGIALALWPTQRSANLAIGAFAPQWHQFGRQPSFGDSPSARILPSLSQKLHQATITAGVGAVSPKTQRAGRRQIEMDWISSNAKELGKYRGQWIVVEGEAVLAADKDYEPARVQAAKGGIDCPLIFFVPDDDLPFMGV